MNPGCPGLYRARGLDQRVEEGLAPAGYDADLYEIYGVAKAPDAQEGGQMLMEASGTTRDEIPRIDYGYVEIRTIPIKGTYRSVPTARLFGLVVLAALLTGLAACSL